MTEKVFCGLSKALCTALTLLFTWVVAAIFIMNHYSYSLPLLALLALASLLFVVLAWLFVVKNEEFFRKNIRYFTLGFLLFMGIVQVLMIFPLRYTPKWDVDALFGGASEWVMTGDFASYHAYFGMFHNNWGGLILFRAVFGIARLFGVKDFFIVASLLNSALSLLTMYLTGSVCEKLVGIRGRMMAYFIFSISLPFYFIAPAFYTDALTMVFPILIFRLYLAARKQNRFWKRLGVFALMGLTAGIGYGIKATVVIMLIAVIIDAALTCDHKKALPLIPVSAVMMLICSLTTRGIILRHLDWDEAKSLEIPLLHWVMMGAFDNGMYDPDEYAFTKSFEDPAERRAAVKERLFERSKSYDIGDYAELFTRKLDIDFGDGTYGLSDCLGCPHGEDNALHALLVNNGEHRDVYKHICTGVLIALYVMIIASCVLDVTGKRTARDLFAPRLALFGLMLFLLFWEARWRYFSNYMPMIIVLAIAGLESIFNRSLSNS
ncbi:MAG: hypothetical protein IKH31_01150 [Clostridia bacterium]|nr:hypothetical protein [Clostridia bacterium]